MLWALVYTVCLEETNHVHCELCLLQVSSGSPSAFVHKMKFFFFFFFSVQRPCEGCVTTYQCGVQGMCSVPLDRTVGIWAWQMVQDMLG